MTGVNLIMIMIRIRMIILTMTEMNLIIIRMMVILLTMTDNSEHDRGEPVSPEPGDGSRPAGEQVPHETSFQ